MTTVLFLFIPLLRFFFVLLAICRSLLLVDIRVRHSMEFAGGVFFECGLGVVLFSVPDTSRSAYPKGFSSTHEMILLCRRLHLLLLYVHVFEYPPFQFRCRELKARFTECRVHNKGTLFLREYLRIMKPTPYGRMFNFLWACSDPRSLPYERYAISSHNL
jgi:hypothetical protein